MASDLGFSIRVRQEAESDIESIVANFLEYGNLPALNKWLAELEQIKQRLVVNPFLYQTYEVFLHRANFHKSPYFAAYAIDTVNMEVEILMIAHQQSNPDRLLRRINL